MTVNLSNETLMVVEAASKHFGISADDVVERAIILYGRTLPPEATANMLELIFPKSITRYKHDRRYLKLEGEEGERSDGSPDSDRLRAASEIFG